MTPMSSIPSMPVSVQLLRPLLLLLLLGMSGARGPVPSAAGGLLDQGVEPGAEGECADDPGDAERRADDRRADGHRRPALTRVEGHRDAKLRWRARSGCCASSDALGRRPGGADRCHADPGGARAAPNRTVAPSRATSSSAPERQHEDIDVDAGAGLGRTSLADGHQRRSHRSRARRRAPAPATMTGSTDRTSPMVHSVRLSPIARSVGRSRRSPPSAGGALARPATSAASAATAAKAVNPTARTRVPSSTFSAWSESAG